MFESPADARSPRFPVLKREPRLADRVADQILNTILEGELNPGDRLPSERELGEQFAVSRTVIREAIRSLAAKGVIVTQAGSGIRVAAVDADAVSQSMMLYFRGRDLLDYEPVHEVRSMLEIHVAGVAAERATETDVEQLTETWKAIQAAPDPDEMAKADLEFHRMVARASHNDLFLVILDSIQPLLLEVRKAVLESDPVGARKAVPHHKRILERIAAHDPEGAREAMRRHLRDAEAWWKKRARSGAGAD